MYKSNNKLLVTDLSFKFGKFTFELPIRAARVAISGDSGTGKTLAYSLMEDAEIGSSSIPEIGAVRDKLVFLNYKQNESDIRHALETYHDKVIIIDNADISLRGKDIQDLLDNTPNQLILSTRRGIYYKIPYVFTADLEREGNRVYLEYWE